MDPPADAKSAATPLRASKSLAASLSLGSDSALRHIPFTSVRPAAAGPSMSSTIM